MYVLNVRADGSGMHIFPFMLPCFPDEMTAYLVHIRRTTLIWRGEREKEEGRLVNIDREERDSTR